MIKSWAGAVRMTECCRTFPVVDVADICPQYSRAEAGRAHNTIKYYCWVYHLRLHKQKLSGEIIKTKLSDCPCWLLAVTESEDLFEFNYLKRLGPGVSDQSLIIISSPFRQDLISDISNLKTFLEK